MQSVRLLASLIFPRRAQINLWLASETKRQASGSSRACGARPVHLPQASDFHSAFRPDIQQVVVVALVDWSAADAYNVSRRQILRGAIKSVLVRSQGGSSSSAAWPLRWLLQLPAPNSPTWPGSRVTSSLRLPRSGRSLCDLAI